MSPIDMIHLCKLSHGQKVSRNFSTIHFLTHRFQNELNPLGSKRPFLDTLRFAQLRKNKLNQQLKFFNIINKNVTQNFLVFSDHSWNGAALIFAVKLAENFKKKFFQKIFIRHEKYFQVVSA